MNINLLLNLNLKSTSGDSITGTSDFNLFLKPFYATEKDILDGFIEEQDTYLTTVQKLIFEGSLKADDILSYSTEAELGISKEAGFRIRRDYVICYAIYKFANIFYRDFLTSVKKDKFLADMKVSLQIDKDPHMIRQISADAKECMEEISENLNIGSSMSSFVKGRLNSCNYSSSRGWYPGDSNGNPKVSIAAIKVRDMCRKYKIGPSGGNF